MGERDRSSGERGGTPAGRHGASGGLSGPAGEAPEPGRILSTLQAARDIYEGMFIAPYRSALYREHRRQHDLFLLLVLSDLLGVPNPVSFYTLELYPDLIGHYHEWHRRMGMEHAPEGGFRCC